MFNGSVTGLTLAAFSLMVSVFFFSSVVIRSAERYSVWKPATP